VGVLLALLMIEKLGFLFAALILARCEFSDCVARLLIAIAGAKVEVHNQILVDFGFRWQVVRAPLRLHIAIVLGVRTRHVEIII
jgi:hypothetical protein